MLVSWKAAGRAKQLQYMKTEEFRRYARFRNGVEAIPSLLRRRYHVDKSQHTVGIEPDFILDLK